METKLTQIEDLWEFAEKDSMSDAFSGFKRLNFFGYLGFSKILCKNHLKLERFLKKAKQKKACYVGPFLGEFGNFLGNMLPFLGYLNEEGIDIHYMGLSIQKPLLKDSNGSSILKSMVEVRPLFNDAKASANKLDNIPEDVKHQMKSFFDQAQHDGLPLLDIFSDSNLYWYNFRNWQLRGKQHVYTLQKVYAPNGKKNKIAIFPRNKPAAFFQNNGALWDYDELALLCTNYADEVVFVGQPSMSASLNMDHPKISSELSIANEDTLKSCAESVLIITQHSGAMQLAPIVNTDTLCIFKGEPPIGSLCNTIRFRKNFPPNHTNLAFTLEQITDYLDFRKEQGLFD